MRAAAPQAGREAIERMQAQAALGISKRMALAAELLVEALGADCDAQLAAHASDTVRGWACFVIGAPPNLPLRTRLERIRPMADDSHFGVREWAWLAVRPRLAADLPAAIQARSEARRVGHEGVSTVSSGRSPEHATKNKGK